MTTDDILKNSQDTYLCLIHPDPKSEETKAKVASLSAIGRSVPSHVIHELLIGASWRERLLGLPLVFAQNPIVFIDFILKSLHDPRGIAIVPYFAALGVFARRGIFPITDSFQHSFDRTAFDGEIGWAADRTIHYSKSSLIGNSSAGPNYGQIYEDHAEIYDQIYRA